MADKIILVDTGYYRRIKNDKEKIRIHYESHKKNQPSSIWFVHAKTLEELDKKFQDDTKHEQRTNKIKNELISDGFLIYDLYHGDPMRAFSREDLILRLNKTDPNQEQNSQTMTKNWNDRYGQTLPSKSKLITDHKTDEENYKNNIFSKIATSEGSLTHRIKLDEILNQVKAYLFPELI